MYKTVLRIFNHVKCVREAIAMVNNELQRRADCHDASKFTKEELEYYAAYEKLPEGLVFGSDEYNAALKALNVGVGTPGFNLHSSRNDHHPEFYDDAHEMGFMAIIEMVCDWHGAMKAYGNKQDWLESVDYNISRFDFSEHQIWLINEVANFLYEKDKE